MHVPLLLVGPGVAPGVSDTPVSTRRVFHTILDWAGLGAADSLRGAEPEVVLGEAMKPFLAYGWQPQVMAVEGRTKAILAGRLEVYDVVADPGGVARPRRRGASLSRPLRTALRDYPVPSLGAARAAAEASERRSGASSRASATSAPGARPWCARTRRARPTWPGSSTSSTRPPGSSSARSTRGSIPLLERIRAEDPGNLDAALRLATAHSALGHERAGARARSSEAGEIAPGSQDVRTYLALHYARGEGLGARGAAARAGRGRVARPPAGARGPGARRGSGRAASRRRSPCGSRSTRMRTPVAGGARPARRAGHGRGADRARHRVVRAGARGRRARPSRTTSSSACSTSPRGASPRRATPSTACPPSHPGVPDGALQAGAGERAARRARPGRAHRRARGGGPTRRPATLIARERLFQAGPARR